MKILMLCGSCECLFSEMYQSKMSLIPGGKEDIVIATDSPLVPGTYYSLLLKGAYPGSGVRCDCVGDMISFKSTEMLKAVDFQQEDRVRNPDRYTSED